MISHGHTILAAGCLALAACTDATAPTRIADGPALRTTSVTEPTSGPWARIVEGVTGEGALYTIHVPRTEVANGAAVYYAHGIRDASSPVDLRDQDSFYTIRDRLGELGYTVAYSSWSENGFAVQDGAQRTHQLRGLVAAELGGMPERNFLVGHSLGGGIAIDLAQRYPQQYDGVLAVCGMVGGSKIETQYIANVRALADAYFPGRFPGTLLGVPEGTVVTLPEVIAAVQSNPMGLYAIASTKQTPLPYVDIPAAGPVTNPATPAFQTLVGSLYAGIQFHARAINNVMDLTHGQTPFDNADTRYELGRPVLPAPLVAPLIDASNERVERLSFGQAAENYLDHNFSSTGDLRIPAITIHNVWDPVVPAFHEDTLRARVIAAGNGAMLEQRWVPAYGHCAIPATTVVQGFVDLANRAGPNMRR